MVRVTPAYTLGGGRGARGPCFPKVALQAVVLGNVNRCSLGKGLGNTEIGF